MADPTEASGVQETPDDWGQTDTGSGGVEPPSYQDPAFLGDRGFYRTVIWFLGWIIILGIGGILVLSAFSEQGAPDGLIAIISTAVGALAGVLTSRR